MWRVATPARVLPAVAAGAVLMSLGVAHASTAHSNKANGLAYAKQQVKNYSEHTGALVAGPPIKGGIKSLKGKTVYFVPQSSLIPYQAAVISGVQSAAAAAGLKLVVCNGGGSPSTEAGCFSQALTSGAAGVAEDGITVGQVQQSVNALSAKNIPFVEGGLTQAKGNDKVAYAWNNSFLQSSLAADALIADTNGNANILVVRHTDSPATEAFMDQGGLAQIKENCPDCKVTTIDTNAAQLSQLTSQVSAAVEKDPSINAILVAFDFDVSSVEASLQDLDKKIPIFGTTGLLPGLEGIKAGSGEVADAGTNPAYAGWAIVDQLLRMMRHQQPNTLVPMPVRLFTKSNINSFSLTQTAFSDGAWYGTKNFQKMFETLWAGKAA
jgi:ribose transport system substrate-binding protein